MPVGVIRAFYLSITTDQSKIKAAETFRKNVSSEVTYFTSFNNSLRYCVRSAEWLFYVRNVG